METVYGVAKTGAAIKAFVAHVRSRMRRVVRGHDKPYAIYEPFGGEPDGPEFDESEQYLLDNLAKVAQGQRETGCHFDFYSIDFWADYQRRSEAVRSRPVSQRADKDPSGIGKAGHAAGLVDRQFAGRSGRSAAIRRSRAA